MPLGVTRVAIVGASGYTARELMRILAHHPAARLEAVTTRDPERSTVAALHPSLRGQVDLACEPFDARRLAGMVDCVFLALPHKTSMQAAAALLAEGTRVIDLSADYRLRDPNVYAEWYGESHADVANLEHAVYGLPELYAEDIVAARLIANPGCYPTSAILGLAPLLSGDLIEPSDLIVDSKSGVSGAGRSPKLTTHFPECNESLSAYGVGEHRHQPEIEQILGEVADCPVEVLFTPHLVPMDRGILSTIYARPKQPVDAASLLALYRDYYAGKPFVRVREDLPGTKDTVGTNYCDITVRVVRERIVVLSAIDNLIKGASGAAVQNMNLLFGHPETAGLA